MTTNKSSEFVSEETVSHGKWLCLKDVTYKDPNGRVRQWEMVSRTTKHEGSADGVAIIATLKRKSKPDCVICIKQYRPPLRAITLEFPAGLIDAGESVEQAAKREMKEETGFTISAFKHVSSPTSLDAGLEDCTLVFATVEINGDDLANQVPKQSLDETEFIEIVHIPVQGFLSTVQEMAKTQVVIDSRVYSYALALSSIAV